jgi:hypothetical protein
MNVNVLDFNKDLNFLAAISSTKDKNIGNKNVPLLLDCYTAVLIYSIILQILFSTSTINTSFFFYLKNPFRKKNSFFGKRLMFFNYKSQLLYSFEFQKPCLLPRL